MVTPIGLDHIGGNYFWIWAVVCASFVPLTYFFGVETSGRTLEQIDDMFFEHPRALMGLDKRSTVVIKASKQDEENRFRALGKADGKNTERVSVEQVEEGTKQE